MKREDLLINAIYECNGRRVILLNTDVDGDAMVMGLSKEKPISAPYEAKKYSEYFTLSMGQFLNCFTLVEYEENVVLGKANYMARDGSIKNAKLIDGKWMAPKSDLK